ncbi:MAG TPA: hypothetical protein PK954_11205, partial [Anaerolineales bacterium]|nr:hypothetical protein [Anaerolineales bacterium]
MRFDDTAGDRKAQTRAAGRRAWQSIELLEHTVESVCRKARPAVCHHDRQMIAVAEGQQAYACTR